MTLRGTVEAVDKENRTVTLKGPKERTMTLAVRDPQKLEAVKVRDPKNLVGVKVGDLVQLTYTQALAVALDKAPRSDHCLALVSCL